VSDVIAAVTFAREQDLSVAVRSGGHSFAGYGTADGGIVVDLSRMREIEIDPVTRIARVEPGLRWADVANEAQRYGLGLTSGDMGTVGVGGLTLGGGVGWMVRKYGLTIDNLLSVDLVTADGQFLRASADENPELFWAVRGGGGNFGIATSFTFRLHPAGMILGGATFYDAADAERIVRTAARYAAGAPDELTTMIMFMPVPPAPFIPAEKQFTPSVAILMVYAGDGEEGQRVTMPLRTLAEPIADIVAPMPYPAIFKLTEQGGARGNHHHRSMYVREVTDEALDALTAAAQSARFPTAMTQIRILGGAMSRVPADATAFSHRDKQLMVSFFDGWVNSDEAVERMHGVDRMWESVRPYASGVYANFLGNEGEERVREAYSERTYRRLAEIKQAYDPSNLFALNQNIAPSAPYEERLAA
jgi:FAD/FMN-containing dehydrogenase